MPITCFCASSDSSEFSALRYASSSILNYSVLLTNSSLSLNGNSTSLAYLFKMLELTSTNDFLFKIDFLPIELG